MLGRQEPRQGQAPSTFMGKLGAVGECAVAGAAVVGLLVAVLSGGAIPLILGAVGLGAVLGGVAGIISQI